jgi:hypothetical protein
MGSSRTFVLIAAAAIAAPAIASAQETEHVFVTGAMQDREQRLAMGAAQDTGSRIIVIGAMQDREQHVNVVGAAQETEHVFVTGATQDREQRVTVIGAAQDREPLVTVVGAVNDRRTATAETPADRSLRIIPVVYEDAPPPAPARTATPAPASQPGR